jgi:hypothetical protein
MPWLILGICVIVGLWLIFRGLKGLAPQIAAKVIVSAIVLAASGVALYFLTASRGIGTLLFVAAFLLPMLMRMRGARQFFQNLGGPSQGKSTDVCGCRSIMIPAFSTVQCSTARFEVGASAKWRRMS